MHLPSILVGIGIAVLFQALLFIVRPWTKARLLGQPIGLLQVLGLRLRGMPAGLIVDAYLELVRQGVPVTFLSVETTYMGNSNNHWTPSSLATSTTSAIVESLREQANAQSVSLYVQAQQAGLRLPLSLIQAHAVAGGNTGDVVRALIEADKAGIELSFERAAAIDLAPESPSGGILHAVRAATHPRTISCLPPGAPRDHLELVAGDGVRLLCTVTATVRIRLDYCVGGAPESTIAARVAEHVAQLVGETPDHQIVLQQPAKLSSSVLQAGLDAGAADQILSCEVNAWSASDAR
jgi:uncharacterized protein YqfA (UPF0365 family)